MVTGETRLDGNKEGPDDIQRSVKWKRETVDIIRDD